MRRETWLSGVTMAAIEPSENWKPEAVLDQLREQAQASGTATAQVFLSPAEAGADIAETARTLVSDAAAGRERGSKAPSIGRVSTLAKSFSLTADPALFAVLARHPKIKAILPSTIEDIYPKPTKIVPSEPPKSAKP
jgi:hypothetical protein